MGVIENAILARPLTSIGSRKFHEDIEIDHAAVFDQPDAAHALIEFANRSRSAISGQRRESSAHWIGGIRGGGTVDPEMLGQCAAKALES